jgi:hypothetical protein
MSTEFEGLDLSEMQNEFERVNSEPGGFNRDEFLQKFVRLPERDGYTLMRILPRKKGAKHVAATRVHTLNNPTTNEKRTFHCPKVLVKTDRGERWQGDCIICKYYSDLWQKSEPLSGKAQEDLQNQARAIKPVERYYYNVIVRAEKDFKTGDTKKNVGPKIYSCGKQVHAKILRAIIGDPSAGEKGLGDVTHPKDGRDFRVVKKVIKGGGNKEYPNYDNSKFDDVSPAGSPDELENWLENLHDLQALRVVKSPEELKQALRVHLGMVVEGVAKDDELSEFRNVGVSSAPSRPSNVSESVREELAVSSAPVTSSESKEDILAPDDDFLKELEGM